MFILWLEKMSRRILGGIYVRKLLIPLKRNSLKWMFCGLENFTEKQTKQKLNKAPSQITW